MARSSWQAWQGLTGKEEPIGKQCAQEDQEDKAAQEGKDYELLSSCVRRGAIYVMYALELVANGTALVWVTAAPPHCVHGKPCAFTNCRLQLAQLIGNTSRHLSRAVVSHVAHREVDAELCEAKRHGLLGFDFILQARASWVCPNAVLKLLQHALPLYAQLFAILWDLTNHDCSEEKL